MSGKEWVEVRSGGMVPCLRLPITSLQGRETGLAEMLYMRSSVLAGLRTAVGVRQCLAM